MLIEFTCGRLRLARHLALAALGVYGAWAWFGWSGVLPTLLWAWHGAPRPGRIARVTVARVLAVQLGRWRTVIRAAGMAPIEIFHDELEPAALAGLRRQLKALCSAGHGPEHVEPV